MSLGPLKRLLVIGAHPDDIEIGCGATVLRLVEEHGGLEVCWLVLSGTEERATEAQASARAFLGPSARSSNILVKTFRDGFLPWSGGEVKEVFEDLKGGWDPDLILTHRREDAHQDHRLVAELTWNTWRDHLILEYEIPKYEGDLGAPNLFVPVAEETARRKVDLVMKGFPSQHRRPWFEPETFWSLLRLRGLESNSPSRYAEGFHTRKMLLP